MPHRRRPAPAFDHLESRRLLDGSGPPPMDPPPPPPPADTTPTDPPPMDMPDLDPAVIDLDNQVAALGPCAVAPPAVQIAAGTAPTRDQIIAVIEAARTGMNYQISEGIKVVTAELKEVDDALTTAETDKGLYETLPDTPKNRMNLAEVNKDIDTLSQLKQNLGIEIFDLSEAKVNFNKAADALIVAIKLVTWTDPVMGDMTYYTNDELDFCC